MAMGVRIYQYLPTHLHSKVLVIDDAVGVVGSSNVDMRSFFLNFELGVFFYGRREIEALAALFEEDLAGSREIVPAQFAQRGRVARFIEDTCRIFSPLF